MKNIFLLTIITIVLILSSCSDNKNSDIYQLDDKSYASKHGKFSINFPRKPNLEVIENNLGDLKFNIYAYRLNYGEKIFYNLSYMDYPENIMNTLTNEDI